MLAVVTVVAVVVVAATVPAVAVSASGVVASVFFFVVVVVIIVVVCSVSLASEIAASVASWSVLSSGGGSPVGIVFTVSETVVDEIAVDLVVVIGMVVFVAVVVVVSSSWNQGSMLLSRSVVAIVANSPSISRADDTCSICAVSANIFVAEGSPSRLSCCCSSNWFTNWTTCSSICSVCWRNSKIRLEQQSACRRECRKGGRESEREWESHK